MSGNGGLSAAQYPLAVLLRRLYLTRSQAMPLLQPPVPRLLVGMQTNCPVSSPVSGPVSSPGISLKGQGAASSAGAVQGKSAAIVPVKSQGGFLRWRRSLHRHVLDPLPVTVISILRR